MDINAYIKPLVKWWRLLAVTALLAIVSSTISSLFLPELYVSRTTLIIGSSISNPNPEAGQLYVSQQLSSVYSEIAQREPVQEATMEALGIDWLPEYEARVVPNTQLIEISVTDTIPARAQIIANEFARQLILQTPAANSSETGQRQEFIKEQLSSLESEIQETTLRIEDLQTKIITVNSISQASEVEREINQLLAKLSILRDNYALFLSNSQQGAVNILNVVEPANLPTQPVSTNKFLIIGLAGGIGLILAVCAAYLLEFMDRTIKTTSDVERIFNLPVIGYLSQISENGNNATYVMKHPNSLVAENYRLLQANLEFFQTYNSAKTILVTSPVQGNGKTTIAINLALSIAMSDQKVILVDADLRRPSVHKALKVSQNPGLADIIHARITAKEVVRSVRGKKIDLVTAGHIPPSVTEVINSKRIGAILNELREDYETIIVDAPPLVIADSYNLASKVDGVVLVLEPGMTNDDQAKVIKEQLSRAGARLIGVVFNKVSEANAKSYGDYQYMSMYSSQHYSDYVSSKSEPEEPESNSKKLLAFFEHGEVPPDVKSSLETAFDKFQSQRQSLLGRFKGKSSK